MPVWIHHRPPERCNLHEFAVAERLANLRGNWLIAWGYYWLDYKGTHREGDFLIVGPDGHIAALEVKKRIRHDSHRGSWDHEADSPVTQVLDQRSGVLAMLTSIAQKRQIALPLIVPMLIGCENHPEDPRPAGLPPENILLGVDRIHAWCRHWQRAMARSRPCRNPAAIHALVLELFGENCEPRANRRFMKATDRLLLDRVTARYEVLDLLAANRQLLFQGGAGTGKSWLALEQARRWACEGLDVLLLSYNKAFGLQMAVRARQPPMLQNPDRITPSTWEQLARKLAEEAGHPLPNPQDADALSRFFEETLPQAMLEAVCSQSIQPRYDALVVDEAQDHNTSDPGGLNWWEIYRALLRQPEHGEPRVAVFYDPAQRPAFRDLYGGRFDVAQLLETFPNAVRVSLRESRRYTQAIALYLQELRSAATQALIEGIQVDDSILGTPPTIESVSDPQHLLERVEEQILTWFNEGLQPTDLLLLARRNPLDSKRGVLRETAARYAGCELIAADQVAIDSTHAQTLACTSFNKSKGLDARAVILLDTAPFDQLSPDDQHAFWMAASRARQRLAVFVYPGAS